MSLLLNNNYASRSISSIGSSSGGITLCAWFKTGDTIPAQGLFAVGSNTLNQYTGMRILAGGILEAGMRSVSGTPATIATLTPNTEYTLTLTRDAAGNTSAVLNGGVPVTKAVTPGTTSYQYYGVGTYYTGSAFLATSNVKIAHVRLYTRILTEVELAEFHGKNLTGIANTNLYDSHSLVSNLNSVAGGTNLTFTDAEGDQPVFDGLDPFTPIGSVNNGNPLQHGKLASWVTNFNPPVTSATIDGVACLNVTSTSFTPPGLFDGQQAARPGDRTLAGTNGTQSASLTVPVGVPDLHGFQTLAGSLNTGLYSWLPAEAEVGDFVIFQTEIGGVPTGTEIDPDGTGRTNHEGQQTLWLVKGDTGMAGRYLVITGPGGEVISIVRYLTSEKISGEFLTAKFLESSFI